MENEIMNENGSMKNENIVADGGSSLGTGAAMAIGAGLAAAVGAGVWLVKKIVGAVNNKKGNANTHDFAVAESEPENVVEVAE